MLSLFLLLIVLQLAASSIDVESDVGKAGSVFHPRGIQQFKGNSHLPFRLLFADATDSRTQGDDYFTFDKLESTSVATIITDKIPFNYLKVTSYAPITMRLYFNPGPHRVSSLEMEIMLMYEDDEGNFVQHPLHFPNRTDALLCPKAERYEFGSCHFRKDHSTFEEIILPIDDWPAEARGYANFTTVSLMLFEGEDRSPVLGAAFYALYDKTH